MKKRCSLPLMILAALLLSVLPGAQSPAGTLPPVMVQDFEAGPAPTVWVVNIPNKNASVALSPDHPFEGRQCLKLHYHFTGQGAFQYMGIANKVNIQAAIHKLYFMVRGDKSGCSYGVQVSDVSGETHQYKIGTIDFAGWKETIVDLDAPHETWGGDKNGRIDYPILGVTLTVGQPADRSRLPVESDLAFDAMRVASDKSAGETLGGQIAVVSPHYGSDVRGDTRITVMAPGFDSVTAKCWKQGGVWGLDSTVANAALDAKGGGSFVFPANAYPHGPLTLRITGTRGALRDNCYLQLYNRGGVSWNEGMPRSAPPAAKGMTLVFADDFDKPLSISSKDPKATYYDHKPPDGHQDFSTLAFRGHDDAANPFMQVDSYLRIRASEKTHSAGLISSLKNDASGVKASLPCYFECRLLGPNAIGTWPAFWLMTDYMTDYKAQGDKTPCDELDIIEAYGGEGLHEPNADDTYMITPHCWNQGEVGKDEETKAFADMRNPCRMRKFGVPSTWFETFHTYGCKVTAKDTVYYCDNIEVGRHETLPICKVRPLFFMINLATGGGWPVDLSRYDGQADMYIDYVRVYKQNP